MSATGVLPPVASIAMMTATTTAQTTTAATAIVMVFPFITTSFHGHFGLDRVLMDIGGAHGDPEPPAARGGNAERLGAVPARLQTVQGDRQRADAAGWKGQGGRDLGHVPVNTHLVVHDNGELA